jgi:hypothetical protein
MGPGSPPQSPSAGGRRRGRASDLAIAATANVHAVALLADTADLAILTIS